MSLPSSAPCSHTSEAIVNRIANREGVDPLEMSPLYEAVDSDALDAIVNSAKGNGASLQITFSYYGYDVTVTGEGIVHVDEATNPARTSL